MLKSTLLQSLAGTSPEPVLLVDDQRVMDIIEAMKVKHKQCAGQYDKIAKQFETGDLYDIFYSLWQFCKQNLSYNEESEDAQYVSSPLTMLRRGYSDCKGYALFIGGVLDALKRDGYDFEWRYRYVPSKFFSTQIGHVFVVITQVYGEKANIWIDPVMNDYDQHFWYLVKRDEKAHVSKRVARVGAMRSMSGRTLGAGASSYFMAQHGAVWATDDSVRANGLTADQMGLPFAMQVLARGFDQKHPGAADAWYSNPPVTFWYNGKQVALPPPNTQVGGPVPLLPVGLTVQYASSFMGYTIPPNFIKPVVVPGSPGFQNKLRLYPQDAPGYPGGATNGLLSANDSFLLIVLEAALGPIINSFSAFPYASNFSSTNNLDDKCFNHRNADDLLQPSISSTVLQTVAPYAEALLSYVPVVGKEVSSLVKAAVPQSYSAAGPSVVDPSLPTPGGGPGLISKPIFLIGAAAIIALLLATND